MQNYVHLYTFKVAAISLTTHPWFYVDIQGRSAFLVHVQHTNLHLKQIPILGTLPSSDSAI